MSAVLSMGIYSTLIGYLGGILDTLEVLSLDLAQYLFMHGSYHRVASPWV